MRIAPSRPLLLVVCLIGGGACGGSASTAPSPLTPVTTSGALDAAAAPDPAAAQAMAANGNGTPIVTSGAHAVSTQTMPTAAPGVVDEILVSGAGFTPQPAVRMGMTASSGTVAGGTFSEYCVGNFPRVPQHLIKLGGPIALLRVLVDSDGNDLTLAIRLPDGSYVCNDDSGDPGNGLNPTVELENPPLGNLEVFVGTFSTYDGGSSYRLGVTEQPGFASAILRH